MTVNVRRRQILVLVLVCLIASQFIFAPKATFAQDNNKDIAAQILAQVNDWRVQEGLWPLKINPTLEAMALAQARYVLPKLDQISASDDETGYHKDDQGRMPQQRAVQAYNWPTYGNPQQIEVGENAAVGSVKTALKFWHDSPIHKKAALSPVYREVGIAALLIKSDYLIIMDLGARPGVLPAYISDGGDTLYPTDERSRYAGTKADGTSIRIFDGQGKALTKSTPWSQSITLPKGLTGNIFVLYTNGTYQSVTEVALPGGVPDASSGGQPVAAVPTATPQTSTETEVVTEVPTEVPADQPTATPVPPTATPKPQNVTLILIYDQQGLIIYNNSGKKMDLSKFSVGSGVGKVSIDSFSKVAPVPTGAFPAGHCLQITYNGQDPTVPGDCKAVRAQIILNPNNVFWKTGTFEVKIGSTVLATCTADAGRCEIDWSQDKG